MPFAEFEEKTFEQQLTRELLSRRSLFFPPGQMLENSLGFDVALFTHRRHFWRMFPDAPFFMPWRRGIDLDVDYLPSYRFNLFIQYKRPEFLNSPLASEWTDWHRLYYRYDLNTNQQATLLDLANRVGRQALVVYASAAFHTYQELWNHARRRELFLFSNYTNAQDLNGHSRYSYADPGHEGFAHSESARIEGHDLFELMNSLIAGKSERTNQQFLVDLGKVADGILSKSSHFSEQYLQIKKLGEFQEFRNAFDVFRVMSIFTLFTNSVWLIGTE
ncbi:MAG: hypothetical protein ABSF91_12810 [Bacteroidota bacterium]|jgi:hypothetical protein